MLTGKVIITRKRALRTRLIEETLSIGVFQPELKGWWLIVGSAEARSMQILIVASRHKLQGDSVTAREEIITLIQRQTGFR